MNVILVVKRFNSCSEILVSIEDLWNNLIVAMRLLNFPKFDESLSHFLNGQILHRRKFQTKEL